MAEPVHIAITRRVRPERVAEFERVLAEFAGRSLGSAGMRGVHCLYPPPGAEVPEYGILRSFASEADQDSFYRSTLYKNWLRDIEPLVEGQPEIRKLNGLEAWFRDTRQSMPPRWKMALLTFLAVWPVSMVVPYLLLPHLADRFHPILQAGIIAAGIVLTLTWIAMPFLVRLAHPWLHPSTSTRP